MYDENTQLRKNCTPTAVDFRSPYLIKEVECGGAAGNIIRIGESNDSEYLSFKKIAIFGSVCSTDNEFPTWSITQLNYGGTLTHTKDYPSYLSCNYVTFTVISSHGWLQLATAENSPSVTSVQQMSINEDQLTCADLGLQSVTIQIAH